MTALVDIAPTGSAKYMRVFRLIRDGIVKVSADWTFGEGSGRGGYDLADTEVLVALTVLALRDLPEAPHAVAEAIRQRPVTAAGEWLVVTGDGQVRRYEHLCLDDLAPFDAARVVRLTPAGVVESGVGAAPATPGAVGSRTSPQPGGFTP